jgi:hypothetical protein
MAMGTADSLAFLSETGCAKIENEKQIDRNPIRARM